MRRDYSRSSDAYLFGPYCGDCGALMRLPGRWFEVWHIVQEHYELTPEELLDVRIRWNLTQDQGIQDQNEVWTLEIWPR